MKNTDLLYVLDALLNLPQKDWLYVLFHPLFWSLLAVTLIATCCYLYLRFAKPRLLRRMQIMADRDLKAEVDEKLKQLSKSIAMSGLLLAIVQGLVLKMTSEEAALAAWSFGMLCILAFALYAFEAQFRRPLVRVIAEAFKRRRSSP